MRGPAIALTRRQRQALFLDLLAELDAEDEDG